MNDGGEAPPRVLAITDRLLLMLVLLVTKLLLFLAMPKRDFADNDDARWLLLPNENARADVATINDTANDLFEMNR